MAFRSQHSEGSLAGRHYKHIKISGHSRVHLGDAHYHYEGTKSGLRSSTIAKQEAILEHLYHPDMDRRSTTIHNLKQSACKWAFGPLKTTLGPWLEQEGGIFWITGKAGSGKSTFMKFLARHPDTQELLNPWAASNSLVVAEHYFWYPTTNNLQRNFEGLLRSLLYTALCKVPEAIATLFPMRWARAGQRSPARWTEEELLCALRELSTLQDTCFALFIDGLDEYIPSRDHGTLVRELESLAGNRNMKLCVASRPWQIFETHFGNFRHRLALYDFTISDMESYISAKLIEAEVDTGLGTSFHDHEREADAFVDDLAQKAEGVFLWTVLIVRSLCQEIEAGRCVRDLRRYVDETPLDLKTFFTTMIVERIKHRNQSGNGRLLKCATLLAEAHMAAVKDADMLDLQDGILHMPFLNLSILTDSDEAEQPDFASQVQIQPLYIADMKVMLEKTQRYIGRMSRDLLHVPLDRDIDDDDLDVRDMDELSQVLGGPGQHEGGVSSSCSTRLPTGRGRTISFKPART